MISKQQPIFRLSLENFFRDEMLSPEIIQVPL